MAQHLANAGTDQHLDERALCASAAELPPERIRELSGYALEKGVALVHALADRGGVDEEKVLAGLATRLNLRLLREAPTRINPEVRGRLSATLATRHQALPVGDHDGFLEVAVSDPFDWRQWDELGHMIDGPIRRVLARRSVIAKSIKEHYGLGADTVERIATNGDADAPSGAGATNLSDADAANEPTVVNLVNKIIAEAIAAGATDIHFEVYDTKYRVRYRVDGMLQDQPIPQNVQRLRAAVVSRVKIMAHLDITERRLPQDGRARVTQSGTEYDLRVSILPAIYGEVINIRLQNRSMVKLELPGLGFQDRERTQIEQLIDRPHGLVLVTGPTGSGKTTTLCTCLTKINRPETKIITIEDPVEYWMDDIVQMQAQDEIGFDFSRALRSILRHDPDVILVGEIRDRETADITIRSALTGHLVFATLHTNDAASAASRLLDIGIEPFLAASSISGILAQRLVRQVCAECKVGHRPEALSDVDVAWEGQGCERCRYTGYRGRTVVAEVLPVTARIRELIQQRQPAERIKAQAREEGMKTLRESTLEAVRAGRTSVAEMLRVTGEDG